MPNESYDGTGKTKSGHHDYQNGFNAEVMAEVLSAASPEAIKFLNPQNYPGAQILCDASELTGEQWLEKRRHYIGGSDCSAVFGVNKFRSNLTVFYEKRRAIAKMPPVPMSESEKWILLFGKMLEPILREWVKMQYPEAELFTDTNMYQMAEHPHIGADVDAIMKINGEYILVEFKTATWRNKEEWDNDKVPKAYEMQVRQYMAVLGIWRTKVFCFFDRDTIIEREVLRDLNAEFDIVRGLDDFWNNHVVTGIEPKPMGVGKDAVSTIRRFITGNTFAGTKTTVDTPMCNLCQRYEHLEMMAADAKDMYDALSNESKLVSAEIIRQMGTNQTMIVQDGANTATYVISQTTKKKTTIDRKALKKMLTQDQWDQVVQEGVCNPTFGLKRK